MPEYDQFGRYEWLGEFWFPKSEKRFSGKLTYSIEHGIQLNFLCDFNDETIDQCDCLYGLLNTGEICSLYSSCDVRVSIICHKCATFNADTIPFDMIILGVHIPFDGLIDGLRMDFSNFQNFCCLNRRKRNIPYQKEPVQEQIEGDLRVSLRHEGLFFWNFSAEECSNTFSCDDKSAETEIQDFFKKLYMKNPKLRVYSRYDLSWMFEIRFEKMRCIRESIDCILDAENLLSLLMFRPVQRKSIKIILDREGKEYSYFCLFSLFDVDGYKINFLKQQLGKHNLALDLNSVDLPCLFFKWNTIKHNYKLFSEILMTHYSRWNYCQTLEEIILSLTMLESTSYLIAGRNKGKYTVAIEKIANDHLLSVFHSYFNTKDIVQLGRALTHLRAEIAHVTASIHYLKKLSINDLVGIVKCIEVIVASHIFSQLGIDKERINNFQEIQIGLMPPRIG